MWRLSFIILMAMGCGCVHAQDFETYKKRVQAEYNQYRTEQERKFKEYRDRINAEFAEYMRQVWPEYQPKPAEPVPDSPEPPAPVVKDPDTEPTEPIPFPFDEVIPAPKPVDPPQPVVPLPKPEPKPVVPSKPTFAFSFYGLNCTLPLEEKHRFALAGSKERHIADGWVALSSDEYLPIIAQCLDYRDKLNLGDWGYVRFVEKMTTAFFPPTQLNEARLMQMFILTQSGYKVRIALAGKNLVLLLPSKDSIYKYPYLVIDGNKYYFRDDPSSRNASLKVFNKEFPKEQYFSLRMSEPPLLPANETVTRHLQSMYTPGLSVDVAINKSLIAFCNDYPLTDSWDVYSNASLSRQAKEQLYPVLKTVLAGKDKPTSANVLLHFVQTAFEYATDDEQFGSERPLFGDETLYYPYSDCEDRAILYSILVRELLGLDVVFLHYPGHLATAVCFDTEVSGDYMNIAGKRYVVCDPTYINADIGFAMPQFKDVSAKVIRIK